MRLRRRANGGPELLATFILVLIPFAVHAQAGYDSEPLPSTFVPRGYQPPPQPATYGEGYGQPRGGVYAPSGENYYRAGQHQDIGPRPPGFQPPQPVQQLRPPQQQQHHNQRPPIARQPGLAPAIQPSTFTTSPHAQKANGEPVNVVIHVFLNEKPKAGQTTHITHTTFRPGTVPPFPPDIVPPTFKHSPMPLTFTRDFDRNKNVFVEDDNADEEGPAQIVEIKAVVDSSDAAMDMKIGRAMARELDRAVPVVMGRLSNKTELNEDLRNRLETELIEEISKNLGERLEGTPDVSESELDTLIDEGFRELEGTTTTRTRPPPPPPTTTTTTTTTTSTITTTTTRRPTTTTTTTTTPRPTPPPTRPPTTSTTTQRTTTITFPQTQRPTPSPPSTTAPASPSLPSPAPSTRPSIRPPPSTTAETRPSPPPQTRPPPPPQTRPPTPAPQTEVAPTTHRIVEWWTVPPTEAPQRTQPPRTEPPRREPPSPPTATWPPMPTHDTVTTTERVPEPVRTFPTVEATRPTTRPTAPPTTRPTTAPPTQPPTPPAPPATTSEETVEPPFAHQGDHFPTEETTRPSMHETPATTRPSPTQPHVPETPPTVTPKTTPRLGRPMTKEEMDELSLDDLIKEIESGINTLEKSEEDKSLESALEDAFKTTSKATVPPTEVTLPPTKPTTPPTEPTLPPTKATEPPTVATLPPTRPTVPPTEPTLPPTRPTEPQTRPPIPVTEHTVPPTAAYEPPTKATPPPTEPTVPPTEPTASPERPTMRPTEPTSPRTRPTLRPIEPIYPPSPETQPPTKATPPPTEPTVPHHIVTVPPTKVTEHPIEAMTEPMTNPTVRPTEATAPKTRPSLPPSEATEAATEAPVPEWSPYSTAGSTIDEEMPFEGTNVFPEHHPGPPGHEGHHAGGTPETPLEPTSSCPDHDSSDTTKADVLFLVDSSHAMDQGAFMDALELIINTTAHFRKIGPEGVQVAVVQYADEPQLEFSLRKHNCLKPLLMDIIDTEYMQGKNMLGHALDKVTRLAFTRERGDRPDAENVLVIITGGASEDKVQAPVQLARSNGMDIFVIASIEANPEYVMELAGSMDNVFHITPQQSGLASRLADRIRKTGQGVHPFVGQRFPTFEEHASHEHMTTEKGEVKDGGEKEDQEEATTVIEHPSEVEPSTAPTHEAETEKPAVQEEGVKSGEAGTSPIHDRKIHLTCSRKAMSMEVEIEGSFDGHIYVEGQRDNANCSQKVERSKADKRIVSFHVGIEECKVATIESTSPPGFNSSAVISFVKHPKVVSLDDRAYLLECFVGRPADSTLDAHLEVHTKKKMIAETVSLALVPPACHYTIRKESPEGGEVEKADLGETVYHRWDCAGGEEAYDVYGMRVHDCYASSDVEQQFPIIDSDGCSSDHSLLLEPVYAEGALSVYAESKAFGMENADSLRFQCKVSLCTRDGDGCEGITPPVCNGNTSALLLSRRLRHNQAADTALTSAVATSVGLTTASISKASPMTVLLIAFALAALVGLIGAVRMNKCQSIRSPIPLITTPSLEDVRIVNEARASRDPRMAEFLSTFERPRYV